MINSTKNEKTVGITGASGSLGKELTKLFRQKGFKVIGFTHSKKDSEINLESPNEWIKWECGKESTLKKHLEKIDILILNHGIYNLSRENANYEQSIEINALSKFKFLNLFEDIALTNKSLIKKEIMLYLSYGEEKLRKSVILLIKTITYFLKVLTHHHFPLIMVFLVLNLFQKQIIILNKKILNL